MSALCRHPSHQSPSIVSVQLALMISGVSLVTTATFVLPLVFLPNPSIYWFICSWISFICLRQLSLCEDSFPFFCAFISIIMVITPLGKDPLLGGICAISNFYPVILGISAKAGGSRLHDCPVKKGPDKKHVAAQDVLLRTDLFPHFYGIIADKIDKALSAQVLAIYQSEYERKPICSDDLRQVGKALLKLCLVDLPFTDSSKKIGYSETESPRAADFVPEAALMMTLAQNVAASRCPNVVDKVSRDQNAAKRSAQMPTIETHQATTDEVEISNSLLQIILNRALGLPSPDKKLDARARVAVLMKDITEMTENPTGKPVAQNPATSHTFVKEIALTNVLNEKRDLSQYQSQQLEILCECLAPQLAHVHRIVGAMAAAWSTQAFTRNEHERLLECYRLLKGMNIHWVEQQVKATICVVAGLAHSKLLCDDRDSISNEAEEIMSKVHTHSFMLMRQLKPLLNDMDIEGLAIKIAASRVTTRRYDDIENSDERQHDYVWHVLRFEDYQTALVTLNSHSLLRLIVMTTSFCVVCAHLRSRFLRAFYFSDSEYVIPPPWGVNRFSIIALVSVLFWAHFIESFRKFIPSILLGWPAAVGASLISQERWATLDGDDYNPYQLMTFLMIIMYLVFTRLPELEGQSKTVRQL